MPPQPSTVGGVGADGRLERQAWRALQAARAFARSPEAAGAEVSFAFDEAAGLVPVGDGAARAWLGWTPQAGWIVRSGAPAAIRALLELYLPICAASARRPGTVGHLGQSLDGQVATASGDSYYVTGPANVRHLHRLRALCDAVVVGAGTVERDDPQLTVRQVDGPNPARVILDPSRRLAAGRRVFTDGAAPTLLIVAADAATGAGGAPGRAELVQVSCAAGRLRLGALLAALHERGLHAVFVEGGGSTVSSFLEAGLLDRLHVAIAPLFAGRGRPGIVLPARDKIADCLRPRHRVFRMGEDVLFDCDLRVGAATDGALGPIERVL